jgi:hypothetical protein
VERLSIDVPSAVVQLGTTYRRLDIRRPLRALGHTHPAGDQTELTGRAWEQFASQDPEMAYLFSRQLNILGFLGAGFGLLAAIISVIPYRLGDRWAWYALWLFPVTVEASPPAC